MAKAIPVQLEEFRKTLAEHVRQAAAGKRFLVTFHGKAVAGLVPVDDLEKVAGKVDLPRRPKPGRK